jgi:hypothetical protein
MTDDYRAELAIMVELTPEELDVFEEIEERIAANGPDLAGALNHKRMFLCGVIHRLFLGALVEGLGDDSADWWKKL